MKDDGILSVSTAGRGGPRARVAPSVVLDLAFAFYVLQDTRPGGSKRMDWYEALEREAPEVVRDAAAFADRPAGVGAGRLLFPLALEFGYAADEDPERFLDDLPDTVVRLRERLAAGAGSDGSPAASDAMAAWLRQPPDPEWPLAVRDTLRALWSALRPGWERSWRPAAEAAARDVADGLRRNGDVLRAIPTHHFAQFEALAGKVREAQARGTLWIVPLAFAAGGGFHLETDEVDALGFGLHADRAHERIEHRIARAAAGAKALADPTRLLLLSLITHFQGMSLTVGDLARQAGVSQPTVSGHLKQLREAGLIATERRGNRTYPTADPDAVRASLDALADVLEL